jgi:preprotein translocase subunit SecE
VAKRKAVTKEEEGNSFVGRTGSFFRESVRELKKVQSPTREETLEFTFRVLALIVIFSLFLGLIDLGLGWLMRAILT